MSPPLRDEAHAAALERLGDQVDKLHDLVEQLGQGQARQQAQQEELMQRAIAACEERMAKTVEQAIARAGRPADWL